MYYSRITLELAKLPPERLKELITKGSYALHQWLWLLFSEGEARKFLFREEERQGFLLFYVLSEYAPKKNDLFKVVTEEFKPKLRKGDRLIFSLRANPTVCRKGRRYDLFMDVKKRTPLLERQNLRKLQQAEAAEWMRRQGDGSGFSLISLNVDSYQGKCVYGKKGDRITFSTLDFSGVLEICDPEIFLRKLLIGFGREKAFGCGLMLIRRQVAR